MCCQYHCHTDPEAHQLALFYSKPPNSCKARWWPLLCFIASADFFFPIMTIKFIFIHETKPQLLQSLPILLFFIGCNHSNSAMLKIIKHSTIIYNTIKYTQKTILISSSYCCHTHLLLEGRTIFNRVILSKYKNNNVLS